MIYTVLAATSLFLMSCANNTAEQMVLAPKAFKEAIDKNAAAPVIDVRTAEEFNNGHIEKAVNIDYNSADFETKIAAYPKDEPIYIYCQGGSRSAGAALKMKELGFTKVYDMQGGMVAYNSEFAPKDAPAANGEMTMADFEKMIDKDKVVLVDFYAEWCAPCQKMKPFLHDLQEQYKDKLKVVKIDTDKHKQLAGIFRINALPTLMIYKDGVKVWHNIGYMDKDALEKEILK